MKKNKVIPEWFDLSKYKTLEKLCDKDLFSQLIVRRECYFYKHNRFLPRYEEYTEYCIEKLTSVIRPLNCDYYHRRRMDRKKYSNLQMTENDSARPMRIIDVTQMNDELTAYIYKNKITRSLRGQKRAVSKVISGRVNLFIELNLKQPDDIIIEDIKEMLPIWREELGIPSKEIVSNSTWGTVKKKIFDYQIFPIMDLMYFSELSNQKITNKILASEVFRSDEYDATNIMQTIKPFIENLMMDFSIEKYQRLNI